MPWSAIIPVKGLQEAKSRLLPAADPARPDLAIAFLSDVLAAVSATSAVNEIVVVSNDPEVHLVAEDFRARWVAEDGPGLNQAGVQGARAARPGNRIALMTADLPCLNGPTVDLVLAEAQEHERAFVCDTPGTGTTMVLAAGADSCRPQFGQRSRARHAASGYVELGLSTALGLPTHALARARRDVDTPVDLWDAVRLGVGPATKAALARDSRP
jgi:2-phospho-L-lactate guanylyltransferase